MGSARPGPCELTPRRPHPRTPAPPHPRTPAPPHLQRTTLYPVSTLKTNLLLVLTAAIWGFAFTAQREGAQFVGAFSFNAARFTLGALSLLPVMAVLRSRVTTPFRTPNYRLTMRWGTLAGLLLFAASTLQQVGIETTTAGKASFITGLYIVLVPILGLVLGHRTNARTWAGVLLAISGLWLLSFVPGFSLVAGDGLVLIGAFFWATHILVIDRANLDVDPLQLSAVQFATCAGMSAVAAVATEDSPFTGLGDAAVPVLYAGLISVGIAYTLQVVAQQWAKPAHAALILSLETVFGAVGGAVVLGETMSARGYTGSALILTGILVSQLPGRARPADPLTSTAHHADPSHADPSRAAPGQRLA